MFKYGDKQHIEGLGVLQLSQPSGVRGGAQDAKVLLAYLTAAHKTYLVSTIMATFVYRNTSI